MAKIGNISISVTVTAPGRPLIGQRRPPPDVDHICAGFTRFWLFTPLEVPDYCINHLPPTRKWQDYWTTTTNHPLGVHASRPGEDEEEPFICVMSMIRFIVDQFIRPPSAVVVLNQPHTHHLSPFLSSPLPDSAALSLPFSPTKSNLSTAVITGDHI